MDRKKKIAIGIAAGALIIYLATRKKKGSTTDATKNGNSFQLASLTNDLWTNGVGVSPFEATRGWGSQNQLLVNKAGNEHLLTKIKNGTKLKLSEGTVITAENILDLKIDEFFRISTIENISGYVNAAGFPNRITIL